MKFCSKVSMFKERYRQVDNQAIKSCKTLGSQCTEHKTIPKDTKNTTKHHQSLYSLVRYLYLFLYNIQIVVKKYCCYKFSLIFTNILRTSNIKVNILNSLGTNTKIPNFECSKHWKSKHQTFRTSHFGPKSNFKHVKHHIKLNSSRTSNHKFQD